MPQRILRIATRNSPLALWQANHIRETLLQFWPGLSIELFPMTTSGDQFVKNQWSRMGRKGLFVKELEEALLNKQADFAVHSMKDVPSTFPQGLFLTAICKRHNPLDAFVSNTHASLKSLPTHAVIGTSSLRRQSQLLAFRSDLRITALRGNIHTRIKKMDAGECDAIILAVAGLERMGMENRIQETLNDEVMLPACGQGALGIECRSDDDELIKILAPLNDPMSALCVRTERQVNAQLGGNCQTPLAIYCKLSTNSQLLLRAKIASENGSTVIGNSQQGHQQDAMTLADVCAHTLLADGADKLLKPQ